MRNNKSNLALLFLSILYMTACCFIFLLLSDLAIDLLLSGKVTFNIDTLKKITVISFIAGTSIGTGGYILSKIDERKARKSPPSDWD